MPHLDHEAFKEHWSQLGEDCSDTVLDVAWRRYQQVQDPSYKTVPESSHPSSQQLLDAFTPLLTHPEIKNTVSQFKTITLPASTIPWTPTGYFVSNDQPFSVFATGRTWRSRVLDLYLPPQFNLWYRIGVNGEIFNSTYDTRTFDAAHGQTGELYLAHQFPGAFFDKTGGRVAGNLSVYDKAEGQFNILIIQWKIGTGIYSDVRPALTRMLRLSSVMEGDHAASHDLLTIATARMSSDYFSRKFPAGWKFLWFLGMGEIFHQETVDEPEIDVTEDAEEKDVPSSDRVIRCCPYKNVGILQKDIEPVLLDRLQVSWTWKFNSLPSRLREDTSISHDYLSLAFEFENGRDLTYTWSWELPVGFGYWCPLASWKDREYHVVLRSGTDELGQWLDEKRDLHQDYVEYVNGGMTTKAVPQQVVRVWLIAGNRWQRHEGQMLIKDIRLQAAQQYPSEEGAIVIF